MTRGDLLRGELEFALAKAAKIVRGLRQGLSREEPLRRFGFPAGPSYIRRMGERKRKSKSKSKSKREDQKRLIAVRHQ
jgi:hypothetical protein